MMIEINIKDWIEYLEKPLVFWAFIAFLVFSVVMAVLKYRTHRAEKGTSIKQTTKGDQSSAIALTNGGNVEVNYVNNGLTAEKLLDRLLLLEKERKIGMLLLDQNNSKEQKVLAQELYVVTEKRTNIDKALEEEAKRRQAAEQALGQLKDQLPAQQIKEAQKSLKEGDTQKAKAVFDEVLKKGSGNIALAAFNSGQLAEGLINFTEAMEKYTLAITLDQDNPDYLAAAGDMARQTADYKQAQIWLEKLLKIREDENKNDLHLAEAQGRLALLYNTQGAYEKAEPLYVCSLDIIEKKLGTNHPDVAGTLNNLAGLYSTQGAYKKAKPLFLRALAIREKKLGKDHPDVATSLNNLAGLYYAQGAYKKAEPLLLRNLDITEKKLGKDHPDVAGALNNLAVLYRTQGAYEKAEPLFLRSLEIQPHPNVVNTLNNLATLYEDQGAYEKTEPLYACVLAIQEKKLGKDHPDVAGTLNNLAGLYRAQGADEKAEPLLLRALDIREKKLGKDHPSVATTLNNLAWLYEDQGAYEKAEPLYVRALAILKRVFPNGHPNIDTIENNYAALKAKMNK